MITIWVLPMAIAEPYTIQAWWLTYTVNNKWEFDSEGESSNASYTSWLGSYIAGVQYIVGYLSEEI